ncbi:MAG: hypothetical protein IJF73_06805 [Clostridia bacterium]|nr:hypothetical protein [Clostridia bacterium]
MKREKSLTVKLGEIARRIQGPRKIAERKRRGYILFAFLLLLLIPAEILLLGRSPMAAVAVLAIYLIALAAFAVNITVADAHYGKRAQRRRTDDLATAYFRTLLTATAAAKEPVFRSTSNDGEELYRIAHEYAANFIPTAAEREALLSAEVLPLAAAPVLGRFTSLLNDLLTGDARGILAFRARIDEAVAAVRQKHIGRYADPQKMLLDENLWLVRQQLFDKRVFFQKITSKRTFLSLFDGVTAYVDRTATAENGRPGGALYLPTREEYERHCTTVRSLRHYDTREMRFALRRDKLKEYKALIDEYRAFCSTRASVGCPTVDIEKCQATYDGILKDNERCWHCKRKFHVRYKEVCPRCHHYICPRCGKCYCDKHIMHRIVSIVEDE